MSEYNRKHHEAAALDIPAQPLIETPATVDVLTGGFIDTIGARVELKLG